MLCCHNKSKYVQFFCTFEIISVLKKQLKKYYTIVPRNKVIIEISSCNSKEAARLLKIYVDYATALFCIYMQLQTTIFLIN